MKKLFSVLVILCWLTLPARSRPPKNGWPGQLEALKTRLSLRRLQLTPQEAEKFWPIYNLYAAEEKKAIFDFRHTPNGNELQFEKTMLSIREKYSDRIPESDFTAQDQRFLYRGTGFQPARPAGDESPPARHAGRTSSGTLDRRTPAKQRIDRDFWPIDR